MPAPPPAPPLAPVLGLGLLSIGKPWGFRRRAVPPYEAAAALLEAAFELGIRHFDTAASYGDGEEKLGRFLRGRAGAGDVTVATKFGEHWDAEAGAPFVDHSYEALARSLDRSLERLGRIDLLQVHKASPEVLRSPELQRALDHARAAGVGRFGASVSSPEAGAAALACGWVQALQFPFNQGHTAFAGVIDAARERGVAVVINRPFGEGRLLYDDGGRAREGEALSGLLRFVAERVGPATILVGTASIDHLRADVEAFRRAVR